MEKTKFAAYMAEKRKQKGLTQEQLAERLYVTSTTVSKWERGVTYPDISMITGICRELDISEHEFFQPVMIWHHVRSKNRLNGIKILCAGFFGRFYFRMLLLW